MQIWLFKEEHETTNQIFRALREEKEKILKKLIHKKVLIVHRLYHPYGTSRTAGTLCSVDDSRITIRGEKSEKWPDPKFYVYRHINLDAILVITEK